MLKTGRGCPFGWFIGGREIQHNGKNLQNVLHQDQKLIHIVLIGTPSYAPLVECCKKGKNILRWVLFFPKPINFETSAIVKQFAVVKHRSKDDNN